MESISLGTVTANPSPHDCALNKQETKQIFEKFISTHHFDAWYAELDPWNRGIVFASHLKKYLPIGFNKWDDIDRMMPGLKMEMVEMVDEVP